MLFDVESSKTKRGGDQTPAFNHGCAKSLSLKLSRADKQMINLNVDELLKGDYSTPLFQTKQPKAHFEAPGWRTPGKVLYVSPKKNVFQDSNHDLTFRKMRQFSKRSIPDSLVPLVNPEVEYMSQNPSAGEYKDMFGPCLIDEATRMTN